MNYNHLNPQPQWYLQIRGHVPETDLSIMATSNDGAKVIHDQQGADTVCRSSASP